MTGRTRHAVQGGGNLENGDRAGGADPLGAARPGTQMFYFNIGPAVGGYAMEKAAVELVSVRACPAVTAACFALLWVLQDVGTSKLTVFSIYSGSV